MNNDPTPSSSSKSGGASSLRDFITPGTDNVVSYRASPHYKWGAGCDGWHLLRDPELSVIEERMPPGATEARHWHQEARQFFYVLSGHLVMEVEDVLCRLGGGEGVEIAPGITHQAINESDEEVRFLVISHPPTHGDRHLRVAPR